MKRFSRTLAKAFSFAKTSLRRVSSRSSNLQLCTLVAISKSLKNASDQQVVQMICKICNQSFNFNKKLYEHIRNHEVLKFVKNFFLSINAINLVCEIEKKSFVTHVSSVSFARFQNSIFESATAFRSVTLLKRSILSHFTLKIESKSAKRSATCRHCKQTFKFKDLLRKHKREQHATKFVINSSFRSHALKSVCKAKKKSAIKNVTTSSTSQELQTFAHEHQKIDVQKHSIVKSVY